MAEPELRVKEITHYGPACESGRHAAHPYETCDDFEQLQALFRAYFERVFAEAYEHAIGKAFSAANQVSIVGNGMRGFLPLEPGREPTPVERALAILDPHLRACPLYQAGPPTLYPQKG